MTMQNRDSNRRKGVVRTSLLLLVFGVAGTFFLTGCSVTGPDENVWTDVRDFSWSTEEGVSMKYRTYEGDAISGEVTVTVNQSESLAEFRGQPMYMLYRPQAGQARQAHFLPLNSDTLVVNRMGFGGEFALVAPLEKGHRWYSAADSTWVAEVIERFAYRKVEGKVYEDVVAVRYQRRELLGGANRDKEYIRFYARGVGDILTIVNVYPSSSSTAVALPTQEERTVLVERSSSDS
jgi:hypothetical protein